ncbi:MAG: hypothetical protein Q8N14_04035 [Candidatus Omnitrophota bacterium]|nr:hypothetical protein [Candidatus Omnitrophota bacterium]
MFVKKPEVKWYFKTSNLVIAFLCVGPLALPMLWFNPRFSKKTKTIISIIVIILAYYLVVATVESVKAIMKNYQQLYQPVF